MTTVFVVVGLLVAAALVLGLRYDRKQRALGAAGGMGKSMRSTRLDNQGKVGEWGAGH